MTSAIASRSGRLVAVAPAYAPDGSLVYATTDGQTVVVYGIPGGKPSQLFTVEAATPASTLDVTADGCGILVSDGNGSLWRWTASTEVHKTPVDSAAGTW